LKTKKAIKGFLYGSIFGFGSPVPGVSAGTVAILLNVYDDFFNSIGMEYVKKNMLAIISFLIGWALGLFGISRIIVFLFENHGQVMGFAFIGLILGCVPLIFKKATLSSSTGGKIRAVEIIFFVPAFVFMIFVAFFGGGATNGSIEYINGVSAADLAWIFFASLVSSMAMLIPGVGGSLMMLVFGIYGIYI
jgi:putative membrane protein